MSRINKTLERGLTDFLESVCSKFTVAWNMQDSQGSQKGIKPPLPYLTMNIISGPSKVGRATEVAAVDDDGDPIVDTFTYKQTFMFTLSIQSFAQKGHLSVLQDIQSAEDLPTKMAILQNVGLAIWVMGEPIDISALRNTGHEMRGSLDIDFAFAIELNDQPGEIQTVDIDGTLTTAAGTEHETNINKTIVP